MSNLWVTLRSISWPELAHKSRATKGYLPRQLRYICQQMRDRCTAKIRSWASREIFWVNCMASVEANHRLNPKVLIGNNRNLKFNYRRTKIRWRDRIRDRWVPVISQEGTKVLRVEITPWRMQTNFVWRKPILSAKTDLRRMKVPWDRNHRR